MVKTMWGHQASLRPTSSRSGKPVGNGHPLVSCHDAGLSLEAFLRQDGVLLPPWGQQCLLGGRSAVARRDRGGAPESDNGDRRSRLSQAGLKGVDAEARLIGDVRGSAWWSDRNWSAIGAELDPAKAETNACFNLMRDEGCPHRQ